MNIATIARTVLALLTTTVPMTVEGAVWKMNLNGWLYRKPSIASTISKQNPAFLQGLS